MLQAVPQHQESVLGLPVTVRRLAALAYASQSGTVAKGVCADTLRQSMLALL
jgi:hypothetical protein